MDRLLQISVENTKLLLPELRTYFLKNRQVFLYQIVFIIFKQVQTNFFDFFSIVVLLVNRRLCRIIEEVRSIFLFFIKCMDGSPYDAGWKHAGKGCIVLTQQPLARHHSGVQPGLPAAQSLLEGPGMSQLRLRAPQIRENKSKRAENLKIILIKCCPLNYCYWQTI